MHFKKGELGHGQTSSGKSYFCFCSLRNYCPQLSVRLSPQSCHPYPRFCLRHENLFPFADLIMCVITSRRDLVQLQPNLPLWKQRNVRLICLSLATVYRGGSGESQINYDTAKARETLASMSRGHVSIGFCMTILFAIKIYAYSLYLFFFLCNSPV